MIRNCKGAGLKIYLKSLKFKCPISISIIVRNVHKVLYNQDIDIYFLLINICKMIIYYYIEK